MTALLRTHRQAASVSIAMARALDRARATSADLSGRATRLGYPSPQVGSGTIPVPATAITPRDCATSLAEPQTMADT